MRREAGWGRWRAGMTVGVAACALWLALASARAEGPAPAVRTIEVVASKQKFEPARIDVKQGEKVKLILHSTDTLHCIEIKEFHVKAKIPKGGDPVTVEFVADQAGTFEFRCSEFCGMGHHSRSASILPRAVRDGRCGT